MRRTRAAVQSSRPARPGWRKAAKDVGLREPWWLFWRRIQWKPWGTAIAAIAAIGTLLFSGVTTYYQARVSSNQLNQAEEDAARAERAQASRITFWVDQTGDGVQRIHLKNGSPDAVSDVLMSFYAEVVVAVQWLWVVDFFVRLPGLGPCTEVVISEEELESDGPNRPGPLPTNANLIGLGVKFYDKDGKHWLRTPGKLEVDPDPAAIWAEPPSEDPNDYTKVEGDSGLFKKPLTLKRASPCG
jgi:hypothetical protein